MTNRSRMISAVVLIAGLVTVLVAGNPGLLATGQPLPRLGGDRPAWYALPDSYDPATPIPLLIALHGLGSRSAEVVEGLRLRAAANRAGVLLVAPDGSFNREGNRYWNGTDFCCDFYRSGVDDVGYLASLIEETQATFSIDAARIYLIGHSNGGFMAHRVACDRSDLVAAIVNVSGATWEDADDCGSPTPVALLQVHGTRDEVIRYRGQRASGGWPGHASVEEGAARWAGINGCAGEPIRGETFDFVRDVPGRETLVLSYPGCPAGVPVAIWSMGGARHVPSFTEAWGRAVTGWLLEQAKPQE